VNPPLDLGLVVNCVEPYDSLEENMELRMTLRVLRDFEQGTEDIWE